MMETPHETLSRSPCCMTAKTLKRPAEIAGVDDVAAVHSTPEYRVYFLGFTAGFPYLGGLDERLAKVPRLETPRQVVPRGSVGVAAGQTGVYTRDTPGGWHLLGRTDAVLFDPSREPPSLLKPGDAVRFVDVAALDDAAPPGKEAPQTRRRELRRAGGRPADARAGFRKTAPVVRRERLRRRGRDESADGERARRE